MKKELKSYFRKALTELKRTFNIGDLKIKGRITTFDHEELEKLKEDNIFSPNNTVLVYNSRDEELPHGFYFVKLEEIIQCPFLRSLSKLLILPTLPWYKGEILSPHTQMYISGPIRQRGRKKGPYFDKILAYYLNDPLAQYRISTKRLIEH